MDEERSVKSVEFIDYNHISRTFTIKIVLYSTPSEDKILTYNINEDELLEMLQSPDLTLSPLMREIKKQYNAKKLESIKKEFFKKEYPSLIDTL